MKKWIGSLVLAGMATVVMAQAPFTIVRPADGSRVRETVHVLIPKGSIPPGGYVGVFLGGKFLEAVVPPLKGKYYDYELNTKKLGIQDTEPGKPLKLELVLYTELNDQSRIQNRTSVDINIGNKANIPIPNSGVQLKYTFHTGQRMVYRMDQQVSISAIGDRENSMGARAAEFTQDGETIRLLYEVMNAYPDGDGLLRIQPMPDKGKDYAMLTAANDQQQKKWMDYDMAPLYMRIHSNGKEVFGSMPTFIPMEGISVTGGFINELLAPFPLPTLPTRPENVGDDWQSQFQEGAIDLSQDPNEITSLVENFPAKGTFVDTEWEMGHPCAKIEHSIEAGTATKDGKKLKASGAQFADDKISLKETIWFALDTHEILKIIRDETIDRKIDNGAMGGGVGGPGMGPGIGGPTGPGGPGFRGKGESSGDFVGPAINMDQNRRGGRPGGLGGPGMMGPPGMGGGPNMGQGMRNGAPGNNVSTSTFIRIRSLRTFTLESRSG